MMFPSAVGLKNGIHISRTTKKIRFSSSLSNSLRIQIAKLTKKLSTLIKQFVRVSSKIQKFFTQSMLAKLNDLSFQETLNFRIKVLTVAGDHGSMTRCFGVSQSLCHLSLCF